MSPDIKNIINQIIPRINEDHSQGKVLVGIDGFIDKIQRPVQSNVNGENVFYPTLESFGQRINYAAGKSAQIELFSELIKLGGNAPILANSLASLGIKNTCLGTFGLPKIRAVFDDIHKDCQLISLGEPAETTALEFDDGKLILSELSTFKDLTWDKIKEIVPLSRLKQICTEVSLIALVDWCNLPHATAIWKGILEDIVKPGLPNKPKVFFDLADPTKKSDEEIEEIVNLIKDFGNYSEVSLGLNENEALRVFQALNEKTDGNLEHIGKSLIKQLQINHLLIHPIDSCLLFTSDSHFSLKGRLVKKPKLTTGGGDNFNAGFIFGLLNNYSLKESMTLAMANSGAYVLSGESPDITELKRYMALWEKE